MLSLSTLGLTVGQLFLLRVAPQNSAIPTVDGHLGQIDSLWLQGPRAKTTRIGDILSKLSRVTLSSRSLHSNSKDGYPVHTKSREPLPTSDVVNSANFADKCLFWYGRPTANCGLCPFLGPGCLTTFPVPNRSWAMALPSFLEVGAPSSLTIAAHRRAIQGESVCCEHDWAGHMYQMGASTLCETESEISSDVLALHNASAI